MLKSITRKEAEGDLDIAILAWVLPSTVHRLGFTGRFGERLTFKTRLEGGCTERREQSRADETRNLWSPPSDGESVLVGVS